MLFSAHVKFWLGAGRGSFGLSGAECVRPSLYCQVYTTPIGDVDKERYMRVKTSEVPIKPSFFATLKSTNYLPNVLNAMDAESDGADQVLSFMDPLFLDITGDCCMLSFPAVSPHHV